MPVLAVITRTELPVIELTSLWCRIAFWRGGGAFLSMLREMQSGTSAER